MKKLLLLIIVVALGWYGFVYFDRDNFSLEEIPRQVSNAMQAVGVDEFLGTQMSVKEKCITPDGEVIYGEVPEGIQCKKVEKVEGSLTVVPRQVITSVNSPVSENGEEANANISTTSEISGNTASQKVMNCESIKRCSQLTSCEQARFFAERCQKLELYDEDRMSCLNHWCGSK